MTTLSFVYYLHDNAEACEREEWIAKQTGLTPDEVQALDIGRPFYEIRLDCNLDLATGKVTILSARST